VWYDRRESPAIFFALRLQLLPEHLETIRTHAERTYPEECCGLLLGRVTGSEKTAIAVWETENVWNPDRAAELLPNQSLLAPGNGEKGLTKARRYAIDPIELLRAQKQGRDRNLSIIGIYHSHPDRPPIPSQCDRQNAAAPYSYLIIAVHQGKATDLRHWILDDAHQFQPAPLRTEIP
jgi:proteasome lid subunit RPN8/RPN11